MNDTEIVIRLCQKLRGLIFFINGERVFITKMDAFDDSCYGRIEKIGDDPIEYKITVPSDKVSITNHEITFVKREETR